MASRDPSISAARWLVGVSAGVVVAFIVAALLAQYVQNAIVGRTGDLVTNAMPSVKALTAARGSLHAMDRDFEREAVDERERAAVQTRATTDRQNLDEEIATYTALPFFPHEPELFAHVTDALAFLDAHYAAWKASPSPATLATLRADAALVDMALERVIMFDAEQGQRLGLEIERIRGGSMGIVALVDGIAVLLAGGAVLLAVRELRRAARARQFEDAARAEREAALRERNEALGQFAGRVAHDVLSPLSTTMLSLDLLRQSHQQDQAALRTTERGIAALQRVHALVDGLLEFARAGGKPEPGAKAEVAPVLGDLIEGLQALAQERHIVLSLDPIPPGWVACSPGVLTSIVTNLVQNAMKYLGEARERRVHVAVIGVGQNWRVEVGDTGPGIPEEQQRRIFEPYVQLARSGGIGGGIGLGLATVDRLVRAHGGVVGVRSRIGAGSTFWFELPRAPSVPA